MANWKREEYSVVWDEDAPDPVIDDEPGIAGVDLGSTYPSAESSGDFDPSDHNIDDVKQFVTDHPDEVQNIYDLELAGKARSSLLDWLTAS